MEHHIIINLYLQECTCQDIVLFIVTTNTNNINTHTHTHVALGRHSGGL